MNMIAVGFKDGKVLLIRGNIARDRQSRLKVVHQEPKEITGVYVTGMEMEREGGREGSRGYSYFSSFFVKVLGFVSLAYVLSWWCLPQLLSMPFCWETQTRRCVCVCVCVRALWA